MTHIIAFTNPRGGVGKSSLVSQLAPAVAMGTPGRDILVLDLSIQGDTSVFLLGGVREPNDAASNERTRGGEVMAALGPGKGAVAFLKAAVAAASAAPARTGSYWRGVYSAAAPAATRTLDWKAFAVRPADVNPDGRCPSNLYLIPGGKALYGLPFEGLAPALRLALAGSGAKVFVDTDAELSERGASLAGIAAADQLAVVLSTSWSDYARSLDDPANSLLAALAFLKTKHADLTPKIGHVVFNNVQKRLSAPSGLASVPGLLPFTPPSSSLESLVEIASHLRSVAVDPAGNRASFFASQTALAATSDFLRTYVTAVPCVPESAWQAAARTGTPLACLPKDASDTAVQAATHVYAVATRF